MDNYIRNKTFIRVSFAPGEHILSVWMRHNLLTGFGHLPFDRCLSYWGLPKQHLKPQRVSGTILEKIIDRITSTESEQEVVWQDRTVRNLWLLSLSDTVDKSLSKVDFGRPNLEQNTFAFPMGWQLCPKCVQENHSQLGYSYWHRDHQLPSIAHCVVHNEPLMTTDSLKRLSALALPARYLDLQMVAVNEVEQLREWSYFVLRIARLIEANQSLPTLLQSQVVKVLGLPARIKYKHKALFDRLMIQLEQDVGQILLSHLFKSWRDGSPRRPNVVWATLSGLNKNQSLRHPVYWLLILFWLRDRLLGLNFDEN